MGGKCLFSGLLNSWSVFSGWPAKVCTVSGHGFVTRYQNTSNLENHYIRAGTDLVTDGIIKLYCLTHISLLLSLTKRSLTVTSSLSIKCLVRQNRALSMSKKDDELNEFIDEVTDEASLTCLVKTPKWSWNLSNSWVADMVVWVFFSVGKHNDALYTLKKRTMDLDDGKHIENEDRHHRSHGGGCDMVWLSDFSLDCLICE